MAGAQNKIKKEQTILAQVIYCLPCIIYIAVLILVLRAHLCKNLASGMFWSSKSEYTIDLSAWWKSRIVVVSSALALGVLLLRVLAKSITIKKTIIYIPMAVYAAAVLLSFAFSRYKNIAWSGMNERYEGTYVHLCYIFMMFYTINTIDSKQKLKIIFGSVIVSLLLLQLFGIAQFTRHDPLRTVIGQKMVFPNYTLDNATGNTIWQEIDRLAKQNPPGSVLENPEKRVNQTVYSFNYVSFYLCVVIPIFAMLFIFSSGVKQKVFTALMFSLLFFNICAANASGGFLGLFFAFIAAVATFWKNLIKWRYRLLIIIALAGFSFLLTDLYMRHIGYTGGNVLSKQISGQVSEALSVKESKKNKIDYFINNKDSIVLSLNNNELVITASRDTNYIIDNISDSQGARLNFLYSSDTITTGDGTVSALGVSFEDERFKDLKVLIPEQTGTFENKRMCIINLKDETKIWPFIIKQEGTFFQTDLGSLVKLRKVPHFGFKDNPNFGTGRGYIWSRTFPLMLKSPLIGSGADTFVFVYPQDDFAGLYYDYGWSGGLIIDKPHNFILHNFVDTGGLSAIALIAILVIYAVQSYKLYSKNITYNIFSKLGAGIYLGVIAFFFAGMVYDTSVNVMPLIYGLLGIGIACNREAISNEQ